MRKEEIVKFLELCSKGLESLSPEERIWVGSFIHEEKSYVREQEDPDMKLLYEVMLETEDRLPLTAQELLICGYLPECEQLEEEAGEEGSEGLKNILTTIEAVQHRLGFTDHCQVYAWDIEQSNGKITAFDHCRLYYGGEWEIEIDFLEKRAELTHNIRSDWGEEFYF